MKAFDDTDLISPGDIPAAIGLLSRLPVPVDSDRATARGARAVWAYPLAGALIGALAALAGWVTAGLGLPVALAAGLALSVQIILTGAMHEDGLADSADGLWGGWTRERRLEIMKDSRIGTYAVLALILSILLRWTALALLVGTAGWLVLPAVAAASRSVMPVLMLALPHARETGLSAAVGRPSREPVLINLGLAGLIALVLTGWAALPMALGLGLATLACGAIARAKIGGQTGDILGASQQVAEIVALLILTMAAS